MPNVNNMLPFKAYLHSMNVIHRDLNSYNCLVREVRKYFFFLNKKEGIKKRKKNSLSSITYSVDMGLTANK